MKKKVDQEEKNIFGGAQKARIEIVSELSVLKVMCSARVANQLVTLL